MSFRQRSALIYVNSPLSFAPVRLTNLVSIKIDENLTEPGG